MSHSDVMTPETILGHGLSLRIDTDPAELHLHFVGEEGFVTFRRMADGYFARWRADGARGGIAYANEWSGVIERGCEMVQPGCTGEPWWGEVAAVAAGLEPGTD